MRRPAVRVAWGEPALPADADGDHAPALHGETGVARPVTHGLHTRQNHRRVKRIVNRRRAIALEIDDDHIALAELGQQRIRRIVSAGSLERSARNTARRASVEASLSVCCWTTRLAEAPKGRHPGISAKKGTLRCKHRKAGHRENGEGRRVCG